MKQFQSDTYGRHIAGVYDEFYSDVSTEMIDRLKELVDDGRALELGIGTGRVALPLQERGVDVAGIDASSEMVEQLRQKPGGDQIAVHIGSFTEIPLDERFDLIYVVFNTIFALLTQEEQLQCFQSVSQRLTDDGVFLVEAFVPDLCRYDRGQRVSAVNIEEDAVQLDVSRLDPVRQQVTSQHVVYSTEGTQLYPVKLRYIWPSEMDLMARLAGLERRHRWGSWTKEAMTAKSEKHISVYGRTG
ncbi:MAG TPA: class I SAM-dependent methyltransferase [Candidatus Sulfomarinibacteraceae bacterium]|nr:class I SAM-dependent methyltransferase [Candidatus Sulfomarinibacteraceae bacterium]